jgi:ABC-type transport system substrate-binding protein
MLNISWKNVGISSIPRATAGVSMCRRSFLRWLSGLASLGLATACLPPGRTDAPPPAAPPNNSPPNNRTVADDLPAADAPEQGRVLTYALAGEPDTLDPANVLTLAAEAAGRPLFDGLLAFGPGLEPRPALAERWTVSPDGLRYTFFLRRGVRFHDGTPFDAEAARYNLERFLGQEMPRRRELTAGIVRAVRALDELTLAMTLERPFSSLPSQLAQFGAAMVSPRAHRELKQDFGRQPVGSGPFRFLKWARGGRLVLERFDEGWHGKPALDRIVMRFVPDESARLAMLEAGEAQLAGNLSLDLLPRLQSNPNLQTDFAPSARSVGIAINTQASPFDDFRVRQALNYALDKEALARVVYEGQAMPLGGPLAPSVSGAAKLPPYPFDPTRARMLLAEAAFPSAPAPRLLGSRGRFPGDTALVQEVQKQLQAVGISTRLEVLDGPHLTAALTRPAAETSLQLTLISWLPSSGEAHGGLYPLFHSSQWMPKGFNSSFYEDRDLDSLLDQAAVATEAARRESFLERAQQHLHEEAPWVFLLSPRTLVARSANLHRPLLLPSEVVSVNEETWLS